MKKLVKENLNEVLRYGDHYNYHNLPYPHFDDKVYRVVKPLDQDEDMIGGPIEDDFGKIFNPKVGDVFTVKASASKRHSIITITYDDETYSIYRKDFYDCIPEYFISVMHE